MNTINPVRPYVSLRNNPQPTTEQTTQAPAFKGALGDKVVKEIANKKPLTAAGIVAMAAGLIGLSKDKVNDIVDSLVGRIRVLQHKNDALTKELQETKESSMQKENNMRAEFAEQERNLRNTYGQAINQKNTEMNTAIAEKDAKIAKLQKYEAMAKVKSIDEIGIVTPKQFLEVLNEAKEAELEAEKSLLTYLFTGKGQENFLAQLERNNTLFKASRDGILKIPEINEAAEKSGLYNIAKHPIRYIEDSTHKVLIRFKEGAQIAYPPIKQQVYENAQALIETVKTRPNQTSSLATTLNSTLTFLNNVENRKNFLINDGYEFLERGEYKSFPYYSFKKGDIRRDYFLKDLANGFLGNYRHTDVDGRVQSATKAWD